MGPRSTADSPQGLAREPVEELAVRFAGGEIEALEATLDEERLNLGHLRELHGPTPEPIANLVYRKTRGRQRLAHDTLFCVSELCEHSTVSA